MHAEPRSVYVHVPFCAHRCGYCDFSIIAGRKELIPRYLQALKLELDRSPFRTEAPRELETLYLGGGTPTQLDSGQLHDLLNLLRNHFRLTEEGEFTIEANPDGLSQEKLEVLKAGGINRISLGVQSFEQPRLIQLERTHSVDEVFSRIEMIESLFGNYSLDLIFAIPGQTLSEWERMLETALAFHPPHLSTYGLTFEKGTRFWSDRHKGHLEAAPDDLEARMYRLCREKLASVGYRHYEISNFARPGYESRHNSVYWSGRPFLAFGPGAANFVCGQRETNHRSSFTWMKRLERGESPVEEVDQLTREERARELFVIGLRRLDGVDLSELGELTGLDLQEICAAEIRDLEQTGWLQRDGNWLRMTADGLEFADEIAARLI